MEVHPVTAADEGEDVSQGGVLPRAYDQIPPKYKRLAKKALVSPTPVKAIRAQCLECCGWSSAEVKRCETLECFLFPYRNGRRPKVAE